MMIATRILLDVAVFISLVLLPWWMTVLLVFVLLWYFPHFYEAIVAGFIIDSLYSAPLSSFGGFQLIFTLGSVFLFGIVEYTKTKVRWYDN